MKKTVHFSCFISALLFCHSDDERDNTVKHHATLWNDPHIYIQQQFEKRTTLNALIQNFINGNAYIKTHWQCSFNHHHCHCIKDGGRPEPVPILPKTPSPENGPLLWFTIQHFNNCPLNILVHWESFFFRYDGKATTTNNQKRCNSLVMMKQWMNPFFGATERLIISWINDVQSEFRFFVCELHAFAFRLLLPFQCVTFFCMLICWLQKLSLRNIQHDSYQCVKTIVEFQITM